MPRPFEECSDREHNFKKSESNFAFSSNLNDITNTRQTEKEKQPKTKQFLEEFRKTFNKCLSSVHAQRKQSSKLNAKQVKNYNYFLNES